ncbi:hypothetical protein TanjilG_22453 [Lupinus angustifolius]|uniref:Annexin n=1 Tax=Lupinus angustifolius TaxID=3871 RepID=A0A4P1RSS2_LUPAN|nr:hypothetical protein TanjilG_22453 [Lupinus angustifolius]
MSTLTIPPSLTTPRDDARTLYKAFKGLGCDTSNVIKILAHRDSVQRDLIQQEYETTYSESLSKRLSSELHGNLKKAVLLWLHDPATRDAIILRQALSPQSGPIVDNQAITEVVCSRTPSQLRRLKEVYLSLYHSYLDRDIENQTNGDHKKLLLAYISVPRYEGPEFDELIVQEDAEELYNAGEKKRGTDEKMFIRIFSERSSAHLAAVASAYKAMHGNTLEKILRKSMKGVGTDDSRLIRVIVTRTEIDMQFIKSAYYSKYGKPLTHAVRSDTSGHYKDFLLRLLGPDY